MKTEHAIPACDPEIFQNGRSVLAIDGRSKDVEKWVKAVAKKAEANVDWHYSGGVAQVLHLGDDESRVRVEDAIQKLEPKLKGTILRQFSQDETGLYRNGVTPVPEGTIAGFYDGGSESTFIVGK